MSIIRFVAGLFTFALFSYSDTTSFLILNDSTVTDCHRRSGFNCRALNAALKSAAATTHKSTLAAHFLDSLGFFRQRWDTLSKDSIRVIAGARSQVVAETVTGADSVILSSFPQIIMPYLYDAGRIRQRAGLLNRLLASNGFPFANVTVNLQKDDRKNGHAQDISVNYIVFTDQICRFAQPLLYGSFVTRKKILLNDYIPRYGQKFDIQKVIDSQRRMMSRPYIKQVTVSAPEIESSDAGGAELVAVPLFIADRSGLGLEGAAGFAASKEMKPSLYGNLRLSLVNVLRSGESAIFDYSGDRSHQQLKFEFSKPWLFNAPLTLDVAAELEVMGEQYGFLSAQMALFSEIGPWWRMGVGANVSEATPGTTSPGEQGTFIGADLIFARIAESPGRGIFSRELIIKSGSGVSRKSKNYSRTRIDFLAGTHLPLFSSQAIQARLISKHLITQESDLVAAEQYRIGGYNSVRGYSDNEFAFRTVIYGQLEYLLYFTKTGAVYIFNDGGIGFEQKTGLDGKYRSMLGYGAGVRLPSRIGSMTVEWARNLDDHRNPGRVHIRLQNELALSAGRILSRF